MYQIQLNLKNNFLKIVMLELNYDYEMYKIKIIPKREMLQVLGSNFVIKILF